MTQPEYKRMVCEEATVLAVASPATRRIVGQLIASAEGFAAQCRAAPKHGKDGNRSGRLLCAVGLGADETSGFLRALDAGLMTLDGHGGFSIPGARACSPNLHLVGREGDHVKLHNEVLIHVTAYAELVLDLGWSPGQIVFDPFFGSDHLDLWGYEAPTARGSSWREGTIVFAAEAKSRVRGHDGLAALQRSFERLETDPTCSVADGHQRKWDEIVRLATANPIEVLLVADGARWWFEAESGDTGVRLRRLNS